jgi:hypothetical protein
VSLKLKVGFAALPIKFGKKGPDAFFLLEVWLCYFKNYILVDFFLLILVIQSTPDITRSKGPKRIFALYREFYRTRVISRASLRVFLLFGSKNSHVISRVLRTRVISRVDCITNSRNFSTFWIFRVAFFHTSKPLTIYQQKKPFIIFLFFRSHFNSQSSWTQNLTKLQILCTNLLTSTNRPSLVGANITSWLLSSSRVEHMRV